MYLYDRMQSRLDALHQISQKKLADILSKIPGRKDLIIDPLLMKPLDCIIGVPFLSSHSVDNLFKLGKSGVKFVTSQWVYLIYSDLITAKRVCDQINANLQKNSQNSYHLIFVPNDLVAVQQLLEEEGVHGIVTVHTFPWEIIRLDGGVLSYELPRLFKMLFVDGDRSMLSAVARSLWSLQLLFGRIPLTLTQGRFSLKIRTMVDILFDELGTSDKSDSEISCVLVVDRD